MDMTDGITAEIPKEFQSILFEELDFTSALSLKTGEIRPKYWAKSSNMQFTSYPSGYTQIRGSIPKFYQGHNYKDLSIKSLAEAINLLEYSYHIDASRCMVRNIEIGVNIKLDEPCNEIVDNLMQYKHHPFISLSPDSFKQIGVKCVLSQYSLKIYNKGKLYTFPEDQNLLRIEMKVKKMVKLKWPSELSLRDLADPSLFGHFSRLLLRAWDEVNLADDHLLNLLKTKEQRQLVSSWHNPRFVSQLKHRNPKEYSAQYKRFRRLNKRYADRDCLKTKIRDLLAQKCSELIDGKD